MRSGEIDFIQHMRSQDVAKIENRDGFKVRECKEMRVIMFADGHEHEEHLYSSDVFRKNLFQDVFVRFAVAHAFDITSAIGRNFAVKSTVPRSWFQQVIPDFLR